MDPDRKRPRRKRVKPIVIDDSESSDDAQPIFVDDEKPKITDEVTPIAIDSSDSDSVREFTENDFTPSAKPPRPRRPSSEKTAAAPPQRPAPIEHAPLSELVLTQRSSELAMSAKRVGEIRAWLRNALSRSGPRLLVLSGPPGSGKGCAVRALCAEQNCEIVEWVAPLPVGRFCDTSYLLSSLDAFLVGTRYPTLLPGGGRRVVLLRDIPVALGDSPVRREQLQDMLSKLARCSPCPAVLTLSDSDKGRARATRLLGAALLDSPFALTIKVNALSATAMKRAVAAVARRRGLDLAPDLLAELCASCGGDLRAALNALHLHFVGAAPAAAAQPNGVGRGVARARGARRARKRPRRETAVDTAALLRSIAKDGSLGTYHAVSKVLNNKRDENGTSKYDVEQVLEDAQAEPQAFLGFLHQNYVDFFGSSEDCADALEILSEADCLMPWNQDQLSRSCLTDCAASVATRGFMFHNKNAVRSGWRPIRGPESFGVASNAAAFVESSRSTFRDAIRLDVATRSTVTESIPYLEKVSGLQIQPWDKGISDTGFRGQDVQLAADIAMVDAESGYGVGAGFKLSSQHTDRSGRSEEILRTQDSVVNCDDNSAEVDAQVEEIQEWDSDDG